MLRSGLKSFVILTLGFCLTMSTWLSPNKLYSEEDTCADPVWFYPYNNCDYLLNLPCTSSFLHDCVVIGLSVGLGACAGVIAGNIAGKKAKEGDHGQKGPCGHDGKRGPPGPSGPTGATGPAFTIPTGPATLTFSFTSLPVTAGITGTWQGFVVEPDQTVNLIGSFDISLAPQNNFMQFTNAQIGTYTIVFLANSAISGLGSELGECVVSNNLNSETSTFAPTAAVSTAGQEVTFDYVYSTQIIP